MKHKCDYKLVGIDAAKVMPGFVLQLGQGVYQCRCGSISIRQVKPKIKKKRRK